MSSPTATAGGQERMVARGAMLQQASQIWGAVCMLVVVTLLGRHFGPRGFGGYTLIASFSAVVATVQVAVDGIAVRSLSSSPIGLERQRAFSTVCALYGILGLLSAGAIASIGLLVLYLVGDFKGLLGELRTAVLFTSLVTAIGWPARASRENLRADHRFGLVAAAESLAFASVAAGVTMLVTFDGPFWAAATMAGSTNIFAGLYCWLTKSFHPGAPTFRAREVSRHDLAELLRAAGALAALGVADLLTYALDPTILGSFRGSRSVGLYGAAARPTNLLYQMTGSLALIVMPVAAAYNAAGDTERIHDLILRGSRYVIAATAPVAIALIVMGAPLLRVWLGPRYVPAAPALAVAGGYWLFTASTGITIWNLIAVGKTSSYFRYAWAVAIANLALSVVLAWQLGLVGVVLGTAMPAVVGFGFLTAIEIRELPVTLKELAWQAWRPGWTVALLVGAVLVVLRVVETPTNVPLLAIETLGSLALGWGVMWKVFLNRSERLLVRSLARI